jgi:hypothetical protein
VAAIEKLKFETVVLPSVVEFMQIVGVAGITRLLLHPNEPKIGFVGKRHETTIENLVGRLSFLPQSSV